jgi:hypothetical protein
MEKLWIYSHVVSFSFVLKKGHKILYLLIEMESKKKLTQQLELEEHLTLEAKKKAQRED